MSISNEYNEEFDKMISLSNKISSLHINLSRVEYEKGKDSLEYKKLVSAIEMSKELENDYISNITKDTSVLPLFKKYAISKNCKRIIEKFKNEAELAKKELFSKSNERYDELLEQRKINIPREKFLKNDYDNYGIKLLTTIIFNLLSSKTYIELIDDYIEQSDNEDIKKALIYEKNLTLSRNEQLENWYFGFTNDLDALFVESDIIMANTLDKPLENYQNLKNNYYVEICDEMIRYILESPYNTKDIKTLYELNILALLLNMDVQAITNSYKLFQDELEVNPYSYEDSAINFVNEIYSKSVPLAKKYKNNK